MKLFLARSVFVVLFGIFVWSTIVSDRMLDKAFLMLFGVVGLIVWAGNVIMDAYERPYAELTPRQRAERAYQVTRTMQASNDRLRKLGLVLDSSREGEK